MTGGYRSATPTCGKDGESWIPLDGGTSGWIFLAFADFHCAAGLLSLGSQSEKAANPSSNAPLTRPPSCGEVVKCKSMEARANLDQTETNGESVVSFHAELPLPLQEAMVNFIEHHPNWDQYRLVQAALAGFLVQNGIESREITRVYVGNMFRRESLLHGV